MANNSSITFLHICRFCLCRDDNCLVPINVLTDSSVTVQEIYYFTGVSLDTVNDTSICVCVDCTIKLKQCTEFRKACLSKNVLFHQLHAIITSKCVVGGSRDASGNSVSGPLMLLKPSQLDDSIDSRDSENFLKEEFIDEVMQDGNVEFENQQVQVISEVEEKELEDFCVDETVMEETNFLPSTKFIDPGDSSLSDSGDHGDDLFPKVEKFAKRVPSPFFDTNVVNGCIRDKSKAAPSSPVGEPLTKRKKQQRKYLCDTCGSLVNDLPRHTLNHSKLVKHPCPHCPVQMVEYSNLLRHIQAVHEKRIRKSCEICGRGFTHNNSYISHMVGPGRGGALNRFVHHGIGDTHKCKVCPKVFRHASGLRGHVKKCHSNATNYECSICGAFFASRYDLKKHSRSHSTEQPYACSKCEKRFKSQYARQIHEQAHSGIRFECSICTRSYRYKSLLRMHLKKEHSDMIT
uniref:Protein krueppel n=1 Tax=Anopheles christyi TaxID=43041 RepID=A0A240PLR5_9DIPT